MTLYREIIYGREVLVSRLSSQSEILLLYRLNISPIPRIWERCGRLLHVFLERDSSGGEATYVLHVAPWKGDEDFYDVLYNQWGVYQYSNPVGGHDMTLTAKINFMMDELRILIYNGDLEREMGVIHYGSPVDPLSNTNVDITLSPPIPFHIITQRPAYDYLRSDISTFG